MGRACPKCGTHNTQDSEFCKKCGTQIDSREEKPILTRTLEASGEELSTGSTFAGRYQIIEELGKGGMGRVYKVLDKETNEKIALKLIKPEIASDKKTIERFRNELTAARKIVQKNVCRMFDLNKTQGSYYITMEYVSGGDLKSLIRRVGQLPARKAVSIAKQLCEGLAEAHRLGVVHRDLKPNNIMIDEDGNAKIMDFGIARMIKGKGITGPGVMIGTPEYMSPEQVEGKETDQRSDIYSLGAVLYEMTTGRVPFEGDTPFTIGVKQKSELPRDPRTVNPQIPEELSRVILRCLEKDKERRYRDAAEVRSALETVEKGIPGTEKDVPPKDTRAAEAGTVTLRKRYAYIAAAAVTVMLIVSAYFLFRKRAEVPPGDELNKMLVVLPFENVGSPGEGYFADGMTDEITDRLSALRELDVIARASADRYRKTDKTIPQIREELNVDYVLTGTVRWNKGREGSGKVRISTRLIKTSDGTQIWSETYDREIEDIFAIQSEIAEQVTRELDLVILSPERIALKQRPTESLKAYNYYLQGKDHFHKMSLSNDKQEGIKAVQMYERATEIDPDFTFAYIALSDVHQTFYFFGLDKTENRSRQAKDAVEKALKLQPDLPEAQACLARYYYRCLLDYDRALEIFEGIQRSRPNAYLGMTAYIYRRKGNYEQATKLLERAISLNPQSSEMLFSLGRIYMQLGRYDEADRQFDRCLFDAPDHITAKRNKAAVALLSRGDTNEARAILDDLPNIPMVIISRFELNIYEGRYENALEDLKSLTQDSFETQAYYYVKDLECAYLYSVQKNDALMKRHAERARVQIEKKVNEHPEDARFHAALGRMYSLLGLKNEAVKEGRRAVEISPVSKNVLEGLSYEENLAKIYALLGDHEAALDQLEYLMSIPSGTVISVPMLQLDPIWNPLRENQRFQRLIKKYSRTQ